MFVAYGLLFVLCYWLFKNTFTVYSAYLLVSVYEWKIHIVRVRFVIMVYTACAGVLLYLTKRKHTVPYGVSTHFALLIYVHQRIYANIFWRRV